MSAVARDSYADVGRAFRASVEAARQADPPLTQGAWAVLSFIHERLVGYSRLSDTFTRYLIAEHSGFAWASIYRMLVTLENAGAIAYERSRKGGPFPISLPANGRSEGRAGTTTNTRSSARELNHKGRASSTIRGARSSRAPYKEPRSSSEKSLRVRDADASPRSVDELFESVIRAVGWSYDELTNGARGKINAALKDLRAANATPAEVAKRAARFRTINPQLTLTPNALAAWWPGLNGSSSTRDEEIPDGYTWSDE